MERKSYKELEEEFYDRQDRQREADNKEHAELMRKRDLGEANWIISYWKRSYFRKNAAKEAKVSVLNGMIPTGEGFQDYYRLQLFIEGNMKEEYQLKQEAFDVLTRGIEKIELPGLDRYTIAYQEGKKQRKKQTS